MHNHMNCIGRLINQGSIEEAKEYLNQMNQKMSIRDIRTGHMIIDAILTDKYNSALQQDVLMDIQVNGEILSFMEDVDLCIIYGNLLDNALEACKKIKEQDKKSKATIAIKTAEVKGMVVISIYNTYKEPIIERDGEFQTTKKDKDLHGIGLNNIKNVVRQYGGDLHINYDGAYFEVKIIF